MRIFQKKWKWRYEIAPMYMQVTAKPLTAKEQIFKVMCGLECPEVLSGDRLPQIGEFIEIPGFGGRYSVMDIRPDAWSHDKISIGRYPVIINLNPDSFGDCDYWQIEHTPKLERMRPIEGWKWTTSVWPPNYENFGYSPSDWTDPELKFKERDFVFGWKKSGAYFLTPKGDKLLGLDPEHKYLYDWFPKLRRDIEEHLWSR